MGVWIFHFWPCLPTNFSTPGIPMYPIFGMLEDAEDPYWLSDFEKNLTRQFWENCDQSWKIFKIAEIVVRGTMFDSPYLGHRSRYSRYFIVVDSPPTCLQDEQKPSVCGRKCPHYRRSNLGDRSKLSFEGPCLTLHISAVNRVIPDILQLSIVCWNVYKVTKNRRSMAENGPTTEGQTL